MGRSPMSTRPMLSAAAMRSQHWNGGCWRRARHPHSRPTWVADLGNRKRMVPSWEPSAFFWPEETSVAAADRAQELLLLARRHQAQRPPQVAAQGHHLVVL